MVNLSAIYGALVGDAAGGTLEFMGRIKPEMAKEAMAMPGGGAMRLGRGQITDDGELTLTIFRHIWPYRDGFGIPRSNMIRAHAEWYNSEPFDMGATCALAFEKASEVVNATKAGQPLDHEALIEYEYYVIKTNAFSEANGALMRATAIATWAAHCISPKAYLATEAAKTDALLSHPSLACQETNAVYVLAVFLLLLGMSPQETLEEVEEYVNESVTSEKVRTWFFEESLDISDLNCQISIGHVRYGFVMAMYYLRHPEVTYEEAIYQTLLKGGDTDTNAAIVGGLVACYQPIPKYMLDPVLKFDCTRARQTRPKEFGVKYCLSNYLKPQGSDIRSLYHFLYPDLCRE